MLTSNSNNPLGSHTILAQSSNERNSFDHPILSPPQFRIFVEPPPPSLHLQHLVMHPAYAIESCTCWITFCFVSRTINHANNSTSTSYMQRPGTKGGSEGRFLAQLIINVNEKRVYPLCIHWRDGMVFRRGLACCVALNTTDFTPDTYRWNEFLVRGWPAIVTLPFSVLLPNQTGSISLLINFSKATCLVLCLVQEDIRSSNLGLTKSVDQFLFFFFFGRCVVRMGLI